MPDAPGKISKIIKGGTMYVRYVAERTYNSEKKYTLPNYRVIGKMVSDNKMVSNENFLKYFGDVDLPKLKRDSERNSCLCIGAFLVIRKVLEEYKLPNILSKYLGNKNLRATYDQVAAGKIFIEFVALIVRNRIYMFLKEEMRKFGQKPNYMTVPAALRELEKIEMVRMTDDEVPAANDVMFSVKCGYFARRICASDREIYCVTSAAGTLETTFNERNFWSGVEVHKERCRYLQERLRKKEYRALELGGLPFLLSAIRKGYDYCFIKKNICFYEEK